MRDGRLKRSTQRLETLQRGRAAHCERTGGWGGTEDGSQHWERRTCCLDHMASVLTWGENTVRQRGKEKKRRDIARAPEWLDLPRVRKAEARLDQGCSNVTLWQEDSQTPHRAPFSARPQRNEVGALGKTPQSHIL